MHYFLTMNLLSAMKISYLFLVFKTFSPPSEEAAEHPARRLPSAVDVVLLNAIAAFQLSCIPLAQQQGGSAAVHRPNGVKEILSVWHSHRLRPACSNAATISYYR